MPADFIEPIKWKDQTLLVLNQLKLPATTEYNPKRTIQEVFHAIADMELRGAPLIGISAAYGMYLGIKDISAQNHDAFIKEMRKNAEYLSKSRPTAINLFWAIDRMVQKAQDLAEKSTEEKKKTLEQEAILIHRQDEQNNQRIGENLLPVLSSPATLLTHCNAGILATSRYGTATSAMYLAKQRGWDLTVYVDETRPYLQGARLTCYELLQAGINVVLICDNMAGSVIRQGKIDAVITGADRVAANGDTANKIGTMSLAVLAKHFDIPFYVAAPTSTIDMNISTGNQIPIEQRDPAEVTNWYGRQIAPHQVKVYNPAFDVTPHQLITAIATEKALVYPPFEKNLKELLPCSAP